MLTTSVEGVVRGPVTIFTVAPSHYLGVKAKGVTCVVEGVPKFVAPVLPWRHAVKYDWRLHPMVRRRMLSSHLLCTPTARVFHFFAGGKSLTEEGTSTVEGYRDWLDHLEAGIPTKIYVGLGGGDWKKLILVRTKWPPWRSSAERKIPPCPR